MHAITFDTPAFLTSVSRFACLALLIATLIKIHPTHVAQHDRPNTIYHMS